MNKFKNNNGNTYIILDLCSFNLIDEEYYKNSFQQYRYALLQQENTSNYVVADMLNVSDWGNGSYFNTLDKAKECYNEKVKNYIK